MGRDKAEKRKRHRSHQKRSSSSDSSDGGSASSSSEESEDTTPTESSSGEEDHHHKSSKKAKINEHRRKQRRRSKHKKEHRTKSKKKREQISAEDYFSKSAEFREWLAKERGVFFSDLTSEQSRKLFRKFVNKWNNGLLKKRYYKGIQSAALEHATQTTYKWKFASKLDKEALDSMRESVSSWTASIGKEKEVETEKKEATQALIGPRPPSSGPLIGPMRGPTIGPVQGPSYPKDLLEEEERKEMERVRQKRERKEMRKHQEMVLDELLPKATGREARIEKKRARAEERRAREISPDVGDSTLMGPSADIQKKIRVRQEERHGRAQAAAHKISEYQEREKARVAAILEMAKANKKEGALW